MYNKLRVLVHEIVVEWVPAPLSIPGNEAADQLT